MAPWVSFEPKVSMSICLLFVGLYITSTIKRKSWMKTHEKVHLETIKDVHTTSSFWSFLIFLMPGFLCSRTFKALYQLWPFLALRKQHPLLELETNGCRIKYSYHVPLWERRMTKSAATKKNTRGLMSVFVMSLANGTADLAVLKQPCSALWKNIIPTIWG